MRMKDAGTFVFGCGVDEKAFLMEAVPRDLLRGPTTMSAIRWCWPRAETTSDSELAVCVTRAWRLQAPEKLKSWAR